MRWAVESELPNGTVVLCLFSAKNENEAREYILNMYRLGHTKVFNLKHLPENVTTEELKSLFPCWVSAAK